MTRYGFVFPGQGSQKVGMGQDILAEYPQCQPLFDTAKRILGRDLQEICFEGPKETLTETYNAQPGIFLISAAIHQILTENGRKASTMAGHSLGELSAYYAAGVFDIATAFQIIKERGEAMAKACPPGDSGMAAIMGMDLTKIYELLTPFKNAPVVAANINCPGQIVISGKKNGPLEAACASLKKNGAKVIPLNVSGAFHSPLMQTASDTLKEKIKDFSFNDAQVPIILNRLAVEEHESESLKENLPVQVISPVRWTKSIERLCQSVDEIIEIGPGRVLSGLIKKISPNTPVTPINNAESLQAFLEKG